MLKRRDGSGDAGELGLEQATNSLDERVDIGCQVLVVDVHAVEAIEVDDACEGIHGVGHPQVVGGRREGGVDASVLHVYYEYIETRDRGRKFLPNGSYGDN